MNPINKCNESLEKKKQTKKKKKTERKAFDDI